MMIEKTQYLAQGEKLTLRLENKAVIILAKAGTITSSACFHEQLKNQEHP